MGKEKQKINQLARLHLLSGNGKHNPLLEKESIKQDIKYQYHGLYNLLCNINSVQALNVHYNRVFNHEIKKMYLFKFLNMCYIMIISRNLFKFTSLSIYSNATRSNVNIFSLIFKHTFMFVFFSSHKILILLTFYSLTLTFKYFLHAATLLFLVLLTGRHPLAT